MRHPLHPALAHFPVACWSLATIADLAGLWWAGWPWWWFNVAMLSIGCVAGLAAVAAGLLELSKLPLGHPADGDAHRHMGMALAAWGLYAASLLLRMSDMQPIRPGGLAILAGVAGFVALVATGWLGGRLVYVHGVGRASPTR